MRADVNAVVLEDADVVAVRPVVERVDVEVETLAVFELIDVDTLCDLAKQTCVCVVGYLCCSRAR